MKKIITLIIVLILAIGSVILITGLIDSKLSGLNLLSWAGCTGEQTDEPKEEPEQEIEVFEGELTFLLLEENGFIYPTFNGKLNATNLPDKYYFSLGEDSREMPEGSFTFKKYGNYYEINFNGSILYDRISAGEHNATLYAYYNGTDKIRMIAETPVTVSQNLYKADYYVIDGNKVVGMDSDAFSNDQKITSNFEFVRDSFVFPTLTAKFYVGELPDKIEFTLNGESKSIDVSECEKIDHGTYYELNIEKIILYSTIARGNCATSLTVSNGDNVILKNTQTVNCEWDLYITSIYDIQLEKSYSAMDCDEWWIGPY